MAGACAKHRPCYWSQTSISTVSTKTTERDPDQYKKGSMEEGRCVIPTGKMFRLGGPQTQD